jgi:cupin 2 domain-containing protein
MRGGGPVVPRGALPPGSAPYRTIGPFDAQSLPQGLRKQHQLKDGAWGLLTLSAGSLRFVWDDAAGGTDALAAPASVVVPPQILHHVEGEGPFELTITFCRG